MPMLFTQTHAKGQVTLLASDTSLLIEAGGDRIAQLAGLPDHVVTHTAVAFNRAMQAVPDRDALDEGWTYQGKSGVWNIRCPMPNLYTAQHDEVTGDNDPAWMFADSHDLIRLMDAIDDVEAEEACDVCYRLVGADALTQHDDSLYCDDCDKTEAERERGLREMADDDRAHAAMERAAGL